MPSASSPLHRRRRFARADYSVILDSASQHLLHGGLARPWAATPLEASALNPISPQLL